MKKVAAIVVASSMLLNTPAWADIPNTTGNLQSSITIQTGQSNPGGSLQLNNILINTNTVSADMPELPASYDSTSAKWWVNRLNITADSPFYPVLRALEELNLLLVRNDEQRIELLSELAEKRISEAQYLAFKAYLDEDVALTQAKIDKLAVQVTKLVIESEKRLSEAQELLSKSIDTNSTQEDDEKDAVDEDETDEDEDIDEKDDDNGDDDDDDDDDDNRKKSKKEKSDHKLAQAQHRIKVMSKVYLQVPASAKPAIMKNLIKFGATKEQLNKLMDEALAVDGPKTNDDQVTKDKTIANSSKTTTKDAKVVKNQAKITNTKGLPPGIAKKQNQDQGKQLPPGQAKKQDAKKIPPGQAKKMQQLR